MNSFRLNIWSQDEYKNIYSNHIKIDRKSNLGILET